MLVTLLSILIFNPVISAVSLAAAWLYKIKLNGKKGFFYFFKFVLPLVLTATVFNFAFSHFGATVLFRFAEMNFTFEALFYGLSQGFMMSSVLVWFSNYGEVVTSQRFISVFGKIMPDTALVFSMILSFIPRLKKNAAEISDARKLVDRGEGKLKKAVNNLSGLITMTLEESIDTAESMRARGFSKRRTVYSKYRFCARDFFVLVTQTVLFAVLLAFRISGKTQFLFDPFVTAAPLPVSAVILFAALSLLPCIIDFTEDARWHYLKRKI